MDLKKKQNIMYLGVHGFEEKTKYHVPGYMKLKKKILMCSSAGGGGLVPNPPNV